MALQPSTKKYLILALAVVIIAAAWTALSFYEKTNRTFNGNDPAWVLIPSGSSPEAIHDSLRVALGNGYGDAVNEMWHILKGRPSKATGAFRIQPGDKVIDVARRLKAGNQTPINLTFNNIRLFDEIVPRISSHFDFTERDFRAVADTLLPSLGFDKRNFIGAFVPDTYEFYWNSSPQKVIRRLVDYRDNFWNEERRAKAKALGLTPLQVATLASIVDEETAVKDEKPLVARLYLNRLQKGMKLQADPTVKFAVGDFSLKRILNKHLATQSPYNTYLVDGLPPGPIRMPEKSTIDAVLDAPRNNYLYMCAKEDFSGRHNFASTLTEHNANAARYRRALDRRGIK